MLLMTSILDAKYVSVSLRPKPSRKMSLSLIKAFNIKLKIVFAFFYSGTVRKTVFVMTGTGANYTESVLTYHKSRVYSIARRKSLNILSWQTIIGI